MEEYSESLVVPTLATVQCVDIIEQMMRSPQLARHPHLKVKRVYADFETTRDKHLYEDEASKAAWPVYAGESFDLWTPDTKRYYAWTKEGVILRRVLERRVRSPTYSEMPPAWLQDGSTHPALHPRIAYRDVTNRTNTRTLIVALIPPKVVTTQSAPWVLWVDPKHLIADEAYLLGVVSSIVGDWWMRRFVEGHVDEEAFSCFRVPNLDRERKYPRRVSSLAGRLAAVDKRFATWAKSLGVECAPLEDGEKEDMIAELDAVVAHLYGLNETQLVHIFHTFHEGWQYEPRLKAVLKHFHKWARHS
jgi:hypothetical protein